MPILPESVSTRSLPGLRQVSQRFDRPILDNPYATTMAEFCAFFADHPPESGNRVALGVGSRGIRNLAVIVRAAVDACRDHGLEPIVVPAMGSHGCGTASGQEAVLRALGITVDTVGAPVCSSTEVVQIAETTHGLPVYFDRIAMACDAIIPVNRIKPHTDFAGEVESGLCKMLAIGFANHEGCSRIHQEGFSRFSRVIPQVATLILDSAPILCGLAIVENAYDETAQVEVIARTDILSGEAELLQIAYSNMPRLLFDEIDVLLIDEIGKEISGAGMDPNVMGRTTAGILAGYTGPTIRRIVVAGLSAHGGGNAIGVGLADFTTAALVEAMDTEATYANAIASGNPESGRIPPVMATTQDALRAALLTAGITDWEQARIVQIRNTLDVSTVSVSPALWAWVEDHPDLTWL
ncbi:MAG: DUF2088 domain-containing protein [Spirochaetaceae bacterium]|nr:MAG: DUF2088 domain-containing protein [Spirochaetaceae bacterium]